MNSPQLMVKAQPEAKQNVAAATPNLSHETTSYSGGKVVAQAAVPTTMNEKGQITAGGLSSKRKRHVTPRSDGATAYPNAQAAARVSRFLDCSM